MKNSPKKISIVEDNKEIMEFLTRTFQNSEEYDCVQTYKDGSSALSFLPKSDVDVVIVDIKLPGKVNGIDCVKQIKGLRPDILFMMYTQFENDNDIFESLKAGASGYLVKSTLKAETIITAIEELLNGGSPMSPSIARRITEFFFNGHGNFKALELLGKREKEVLELLSRGLLYKEIGVELGITTGTVKVHINKIYKKLHVGNRSEAINKYLGRNF